MSGRFLSLRSPLRAACVLAALAAPVTLAVHAPLRAAEQPARTVRPEVGKPLQAAKAALAKKRFQDALQSVTQAEAVADRTAYESYLVNEIKAYALQGLNRNGEALQAMEAAVKSGLIVPADIGVRLHILANLAFKTKDYNKSIEFATQAVKAGVREDDVRVVLAQSHFMKQDYAKATPLFAAVVAADEKAGRKPPEGMIQTVMGSAFRQGDNAAFAAALETMVTHYPKTNYWHDLLTVLRGTQGFSQELQIDVDRLLAATASFSKAQRWMEFAQALLVVHLPGEAEAALKKGYDLGVLGKGEQAPRQQRLMDMTRGLVAEARTSLDKERKEAKTGPDLVTVGLGYAGIGRYEAAIEAITAGLRKGGFKEPQHILLRLGMVQLAAGQTEQAQKTLSSLTKADGTATLGRLWLLQARGRSA